MNILAVDIAGKARNGLLWEIVMENYYGGILYQN